MDEMELVATPRELAPRLLKAVDEAWRQLGPLAMPDLNAKLLVISFGRAFRALQAVQLLAEAEQATAVVTARVLLSAVLQSLYLNASADPAERERRARTAMLVSYDETERQNAHLEQVGIKPGEPAGTFQPRAALMEAWFAEKGLRRALTVEADIAAHLGLGTLYATIYRDASVEIHHGLMAVLHGVPLPGPGEPIDIPLHHAAPDKAAQALDLSVALYAEYVVRTSAALGLGLDAAAVGRLMYESGAPWTPSGPYAVLPEPAGT